MIKGWTFYQGLPQILLVQLSSAFLYNVCIALHKHYPMSHSSALVSELVRACFSMPFAFLRPELILPVADVQNACLFAFIDLLAHSTLFTCVPSLEGGGGKSLVLTRFNRRVLRVHSADCVLMCLEI